MPLMNKIVVYDWNMLLEDVLFAASVKALTCSVPHEIHLIFLALVSISLVIHN